MDTTFKEGKIKIHDRVGIREIQRTIEGKPIRGLVELIINSDDSYRRMEEQEHDESIKTIYISYNSKTRVLKVLDYAQGMSIDEVGEAYEVLGALTSGYTEGKDVGGFFGTGAKAAMACMEDGITYTIRDDKLVKAEVFIEKGELKYRIEGPMEADESVRKKCGIKENGTLASFGVPKDNTLPRFSNLFEGLSNHYRLRKILVNPKRRLILVDENEKKNRKHLGYVRPVGREVRSEVFEIDYGKHGTFEVFVSIWRADSELQQYGDDRQGGLLIADELGNILDCTLFKYDHDQYARRLFGEVVIGRFRILLADETQVVLNPERTGINTKNPFCIELIAEVEKILGEVVEAEKNRAQKEKKTRLEKDEVERYRKAFSILNEIAAVESKPILKLGDSEEGEPDPPEGGLCLYPSMAHISVGKKYGIKLVVDTQVFEAGSQIKIESTNKNITLSTEEITIDKESGRLFSRYFVIEGVEANIEGEVIAKKGKAESKTRVIVSPPKEEKELLKEEGLLFQPEHLTLRPNKIRKVQLLIYVKKLPHGTKVTIESNNDAIKTSLNEIVVDETKAEKHLVTAEIEIWGQGEGQSAEIEAVAGDNMAIMYAEVKKEETAGREGMFRKPDYNQEEDPLQRSSWSKNDGVVSIYVNFPTVRLYLGEAGEYKDAPEAQSFIADIVARTCFDAIARERIEKDELISAETQEWAIQSKINDLEKRYGEKVHRALVRPEVFARESK